MIKFVTILLVTNIGLSCAIHQEKLLTNVEIDFDSYCKKHKNYSASENLQVLISERSTFTKREIIFGSQTYVFDQQIIFNELHDSIVFRGKSKTTFILHSPMLTVKAKNEEAKFNSSANRHDIKIRLIDLIAESNDLICLRSDAIVETAWNSVANDIHRVDAVSQDSVFFRNSLNFNYGPGTKVILFKEANIQFIDLSFVVQRNIPYIMSITGCSVSFLNCRLKCTTTELLHSLVQLIDCETVYLNRIKISGSSTYGFLFNNTRNVIVTNITSKECLQPLVPATWSSNFSVDKLHCTGSVIDAHPSFDVSYRNVIIEEGLMYWNVRSLGVVLENCKFHILPGLEQESLYIGMLNLSPEYSFLSGEYDVLCKNVEWLYKDLGFNGLHVHHSKRFIVDMCVTHEVSVGPNVSEFKILRSHIGRASSGDCNYTIDSTLFEANLQGNTSLRPPLSCSNTGNLIVSNCSFVGYESQFLFDYIHWPTTSITLENCKFCDFQGFASQTYLPKEEYERINVFGGNIPSIKNSFKDVLFNTKAFD